MRTFETDLPAGYTVATHIAGLHSGFLNDLITVLPGILAVIAGCVFTKLTFVQVVLSLLIFAACIYPYFVLHELVHAMVYKTMTHQPVKIGFTRNGAYCSMPEIYTYRPVAVACTAAPLVVFAIMLGAICICAILAAHWFFLPAGLLFTFHLFGCRSDVNLLREIGKYNGSSILVRDNGTEQWIYKQ